METDFSGAGEAEGAGDSVRSALAFFFLADLDSTEAGGFWTAGDAIAVQDRTANIGSAVGRW